MADHDQRSPRGPRPDRAGARPDRQGPRSAAGARPDRLSRPGRPVRSTSPRSESTTSFRRDEPDLPEDVVGRDLDRDIRSELSTLSKDNAEAVARHLVMAGRLLEGDPELAHLHAMAAQGRAGRVGVVREAAGLTAYATGRYDDALRELRTARRLTGSVEHLPEMADCERGLRRPERALALAASPDAAELDAQGVAELRIVCAGARLDMGQADAAVLELRGPELAATRPEDWHARTFVALADALRAAGRDEEAVTWERRALKVDPQGLSGARPLPVRGAVDDEVVVYDEEVQAPPASEVDGVVAADGAHEGGPDPERERS